MSACSASPVRWEGLSDRLIQFSPSQTAPRTSTTAITALSWLVYTIASRVRNDKKYTFSLQHIKLIKQINISWNKRKKLAKSLRFRVPSFARHFKSLKYLSHLTFSTFEGFVDHFLDALGFYFSSHIWSLVIFGRISRLLTTVRWGYFYFISWHRKTYFRKNKRLQILTSDGRQCTRFLRGLVLCFAKKNTPECKLFKWKCYWNAKLREIFWKDFIARTGGTIQNLSNTRLKDLQD